MRRRENDRAAGVLLELMDVHVDGCPSCVANTEEAMHAHVVDGGYVAFYQCSDCGHRWSTAWSDA